MNIIIVGQGNMGQMVSHQAAIKGYDVIETFDVSNIHKLPLCTKRADILVDFSSPAALPQIATYIKASGSALVCGTTGYSHEELDTLRGLSRFAPVLYSSNYSVGIAVLGNILKEFSPLLLDNNFHVEIIETHHIHKVDAPSGTAKSLSHIISGKSNGVPTHSLRGGTVAGEHTVLFLGNDEKLEIKHTALSRRIFAIGALLACQKLIHKDCGWYEFNDLVL